MKKSLHFLMLCGGITAATTGIAQPTLTATGINPIISDVLNTTNTNYVSPGASGAGQTWDLSSMSPASTATQTGVTPSATPNGASFPNANVAFNSAGAYGYYKTSSASWQFYGAVSGGGTVISYSNPEDLLRFPFSYSNTYTDTWATTFVSTYTFYRTGSTTVTADGYGTLTTLVGTFNNVLRVHFVQNYQDSTDFGFGPYIITYQNDQYMWFLNANHYPIASVLTMTIDGSPTTAGYYLNGVVGMEERSNDMISHTVFPNPASENLNININLISNQKVEINLYNSIGSLVEKSISADGLQGDNLYKIDIQDLPQGIYFAEVILNGSSVSTRRFAVSR